MHSGPTKARQRFELRYLITEATAQQVREIVNQRLPADKFAAGNPSGAYSVRSLYLGPEGVDLYWQPERRERNRLTLRLRCYDDQPDSFVFLEIRRDLNQCVLKQRSCIKRSAVPRLLAGAALRPEDLAQFDNQEVALERFRYHMPRPLGRTRIQVNFEREAYVSDDRGCRLTMDRNVQCCQNDEPRLKTGAESPMRGFKDVVILELKFSERFPDYFRTITKLADLHLVEPRTLNDEPGQCP